MTVDLVTLVMLRSRLLPGIEPGHRARLNRLWRWIGDRKLQHTVENMAAGFVPVHRGLHQVKRGTEKGAA